MAVRWAVLILGTSIPLSVDSISSTAEALGDWAIELERILNQMPSSKSPFFIS